MNSLYHDDSYDPRELLEEYAADQHQQDNTTTVTTAIYDVDDCTVLGHARKTVNSFGHSVYFGYWSDSPNVPIKEKRWNHSFSSVEEVTRYMRAWKAAQ